MTRWDEFVVSRQSEEFKLKSAKAKASALQNKNPSRLGRTGLSDMEGTWRADWDQLVLQQPWLSVIQNDRSKIYALAHLPKDKTPGSRQLNRIYGRNTSTIGTKRARYAGRWYIPCGRKRSD